MKTIITALAIACLALAAAIALGQNNFEIPASHGGAPAFLRAAPTYVDARVLSASSNEDHTVPSGGRFVIFSANCSAVYAKRGGTAAVPGADVTDGSASELNPAGWFLEGVTTIGLISPEACVVTLSFYK